MQKIVTFYGFGRSGSNILLDTLGLSSTTYCRNEADTYPSSPLRTLILDRCDNNNLKVNDLYASNYWEQVCEHMSSHWGYRDRIYPRAEPKIYFQKWVNQLNLPHFLIQKQRLRKFLSVVFPELKGEEFQLPAWMLNHDRQKEQINIFKVNIDGIMPWILENRKDIRIIFLLRHPLGYAQSLYKRFYDVNSQDKLTWFREKNIQKIKNKLNYAKSKNVRLSFSTDNIESLNLFESVIWEWIIFHEIAYQLYSPEESVLTVTYERILANPILEVKSVFEHCSIPWNDYIQTQVNYIYSNSAHLAQSFKTYWSDDKQKMVNDILSNSLLSELWDNKLWKSLDELVTIQSGNITYNPFA